MQRAIPCLIICAAVIASANCSYESTARATRPSTTASVDAGPTTSSTVPSSVFEKARVTGELELLAGEFDAVVAAILTDPSIAGHPGHPAIWAYLNLFVPGSAFAEGALNAWAREGAEGRSYRPGRRGRIIESTVTGVTVDESARTATFVLCSTMSAEVFDANGRRVARQEGPTAASGVAEMVGGIWFFRELTETSPAACPHVDIEQPI